MASIVVTVIWVFFWFYVIKLVVSFFSLVIQSVTKVLVQDTHDLEAKVLTLEVKNNVLRIENSQYVALIRALRERIRLMENEGSKANRITGWRGVFGIENGHHPSVEEINDIFRVKAKYAHSDTGGNDDRMKALNVARDEALKELR